VKKILIIGKRGFIGNNLANYLRKSHKISHKNFKDSIRMKSKINNFDYIINTSINKNYIKKRYTSKFDNDYNLSKLIHNSKTTYIFLSTRKVYKPKANIKENDKLLPKSNYSKNKLITEQKLFKQLNRRLLILRISNVIGDKGKIKKIHNTFIDIFFNNINKGFVFDNKKDFKDFISIDKFCEIIKNIIKKKLDGTYNVSIGRKVYLNDLLNWLNKFNKKRFIIKSKNIKDDNFYLNNKKLMSKLKIKNSLSELKRYCFKISDRKFS
tara:strand:+ start:1561 stop:2361 length:801 start_codon:yes stop_codon:yes gene_type:complete